MTDDAVRDLFSAYHDRELNAVEHESVRVALEASPALAKEYEDFCALLSGLSNLAPPADDAPPHTKTEDSAPKVDLLTGVQKRLHKRSGGRYYNDRWSRAAGIFPLEILAALLLLALVLAYFAMTSISIGPARNAQPATPDAPAAPSR